MTRFIIGFKTNIREIEKKIITEIIVPEVEKTSVLLGVPASTAIERENEDEKEPVNNAELLAIHEKGSIDGSLPARPLIEPVIEQEKSFIKRSFDKYLSLSSDGKLEEANIVLEKLAIYLEGKLVEYFDNNVWAPNAPGTIKRKGSAKPLIDTGDLRRSIRAFVYKGGDR